MIVKSDYETIRTVTKNKIFICFIELSLSSDFFICKFFMHGGKHFFVKNGRDIYLRFLRIIFFIFYSRKTLLTIV